MNIALYTLKSIAEIITQPIFVLGMIVFTFALYKQNKKTASMQKMIIGEQINSPFELTISQIAIGIISGAIGSIILSYFGVIFDENSAISLVFLISLLLMFLNPRYICFSYSGAVLGLISIILTQLSVVFNGVVIDIFGSKLNLANLDFAKIDIVALMTMVGILHFIEGILVMLDGKTGAIPVFTSKEGKIIGGFAFKRYWILPISLMLLVKSPDLFSKAIKFGSSYKWPLINASVTADMVKAAFIGSAVVFGGIGYSSVTFTKTKREKTFISGITIMSYGIILALVAQIANINVVTKLLVVIFAPLAHEFMLKISQYLEIKGEPMYISDDEGIMILDVSPRSYAYEMGIRSGDKLIEINNEKIVDEKFIFNTIEKATNFIWFRIKKAAGNIEDLRYNKINFTSEGLGIVFVPRGIPKDSVVVKMEQEKFKDVLDKVKNKKNHHE